MSIFHVIFVVIAVCPASVFSSEVNAECELDVNLCTVEFTNAQEFQNENGFNLTATCIIVDDFMSCVNRVLQPCDVITKNTLRSAIDQLIQIYTNPPYGCELEFAENFEYGNCSQQVTQCAFHKYDAEELKDNSTEACRKFTLFQECMEDNTTSCNGTEQVEIAHSIYNTTNLARQCPYACNRSDIICITTTDTPLVTTDGSIDVTTPLLDGNSTATTAPQNDNATNNLESTTNLVETTNLPDTTKNVETTYSSTSIRETFADLTTTDGNSVSETTEVTTSKMTTETPTSKTTETIKSSTAKPPGETKRTTKKTAATPTPPPTTTPDWGKSGTEALGVSAGLLLGTFILSRRF